MKENNIAGHGSTCSFLARRAFKIKYFWLTVYNCQIDCKTTLGSEEHSRTEGEYPHALVFAKMPRLNWRSGEIVPRGGFVVSQSFFPVCFVSDHVKSVEAQKMTALPKGEREREGWRERKEQKKRN